MDLGEFIPGEIKRREAGPFQLVGDLGGFIPVLGLDADEHVGFRSVADPVVELRHRSIADLGTESTERAALLRDGHGKNGLSPFADLGALRHEAEAVEVHVRSAGDRNKRLPFCTRLLGVVLQAGDGERSSGLEDGPGVAEHILDRRTRGVGVDPQDLVDVALHESKRLVTDPTHRGAVTEQSDVVEFDDLTCTDTSGHCVRVLGLNADDPDVGPERLEVGGDARDQPSAPDGDEDSVDRAGVLTEQFHRNRALAGDHVGIVERMHELEALLGHQTMGLGLGVAVGLAVQHDLRAAGTNGIDLERRRGDRHDDHCSAAELGGGEGNPLSVVSG